MKKIRVLIALLVFTLLPLPFFSQTPPPVGGPTEKPPPEKRDLAWLDGKIAEGKNKLNNLKLDYSREIRSYVSTSKYTIIRKGKKRKAPRRSTYYDRAWKELGLAVLEPITGNVQIVRIRKDRQNLYVMNQGWEVSLEHNEADRKWNGFNTAFAVLDPKDQKCVVLVVKWVMGPDSKKDSKPAKEIVYIPYSRGLYLRPSMIRGREHFNGDYQEAVQRLNQFGVRSVVNPADLITKRFGQGVFERLVQIEHSDPEEYRAFDECKDCVEKLKSPITEDISVEMLGNINKYAPIGPHERVWSRLGVNLHTEFNHITNFAGAVGEMQFTNNGNRRKLGTWDIIRTRYPLARFPSFREGAIDHVYSIMGAICLHDYHLSILVQELGREILNDHQLEHYLAAAYNGGPGNVANAVKKGRRSGVRWYKYLPKLETRTYVEELDFLKSQ